MKYRIKIIKKVDEIWHYPEVKKWFRWRSLMFYNQKDDTGEVVTTFFEEIGYDEKNGAFKVIEKHKNPEIKEVAKKDIVSYEYL